MSESNPVKIILVEDDTDLRESLVDCLELQGYLSTGVANALSFYQEISAKAFDLAIIDIGLPDQSGFEVVSHVNKNKTMGIVILTAMGNSEFRTRGYENGADLYLLKPIGCKELAAAIGNLSVRLSRDIDHLPGLQDSSWMLDSSQLRLTSPTGVQITLTVRETIFMDLLMTHPGQEVTRLRACQLLDFKPDDSHDRRMDSMIRRLRQKISEVSGVELPIHTIYGKGYLFSSSAVVCCHR